MNEGGDLAIHYRLDAFPNGEAVSLGDVESGQALLYVQDSPGLHNLDWNVSIHDSLNQAVSGNLGRVVKLPRTEIAKLKPTLIYTPEGATSYRAVNEAGTNFGYRFPTFYYGQNFNDDDKDKDKDKDNDKDKERDIYFVLAN